MKACGHGPVETLAHAVALVGGTVERSRLMGAEWGPLGAEGWEFLAGHVAGNDGNYRPAWFG